MPVVVIPMIRPWLHSTEERAKDRFGRNVTFQVSHDWKGPWKTIARSLQGHDTLAIDTAKGYAAVESDLTPFKRWLGKLNCGRIVLESGEAATFDINNLLPPDKRPKP
jgi:hypothetical protein